MPEGEGKVHGHLGSRWGQGQKGYLLLCFLQHSLKALQQNERDMAGQGEEREQGATLRKVTDPGRGARAIGPVY